LHLQTSSFAINARFCISEKNQTKPSEKGKLYQVRRIRNVPSIGMRKRRAHVVVCIVFYGSSKSKRRRPLMESRGGCKIDTTAA
jgi:hypothetical protein